MRTRLTAALLFGGLLLVSLTPAAAMAAPARPAGPPATGSYHALDYGCYGCSDPSHRRDDHYRCMYHCDQRYGYGRRDGYDRYRYDRYRRDRYSQDGGCWYHDGWGWHRCRSGYGYGDGYGYGNGYRSGYGSSGGGDPYYHDSGDYGSDSGPGSGGSDSHRHHSSGG
jgi:hypothetical protein